MDLNMTSALKRSLRNDSRRERIELTDTPLSAVVKLASGNPGAVSALAKLMEQASSIDPDSALGPLGPLFALDRMGIYGSNIWMLWKDVCGESALRMETLFRACQLGKLSESRVIDAARSGEHSFDFDALLKDVQATLPAFGRTATA